MHADLNASVNYSALTDGASWEFALYELYPTGGFTPPLPLSLRLTGYFYQPTAAQPCGCYVVTPYIQSI